ncbi:hypothetical protein EXIGLDRAFT_764595 [Exidia glandulosa HHB12029]|uniref:Uncharacterized protein n=1 Tax=Exidia glandulosa HHB12029 TaxID=1314781 RepID=A0A165L3Q7_EXIGL|nr:hypothetical protein EXIGLDRAFT_764595 [Exidia glandulosa HHB12029]
MAHKLADETLAAILADCLAVADDDFACVSARTSPFALKEVSSSALLVVCKRWMRVGTPLLYETVVLRSVAQARALAAALKANKTFGLYIKKLRVEGGYGASMPAILQAAPNVTDLCVSLELSTGDNAKPMYNALCDTILPTRLIITGIDAEKHNAQLVHALSTLVEGIEEWAQLRVVVIGDRLLYACRALYEAIRAAPQLGLIHIPDTRPYINNWILYYSRFAARCAAPALRVGWEEHYRSGDIGPSVRQSDIDPKGLAKIQFREAKLTGYELCAKRVEQSSSSNPFFVPLAGSPDSTRRAIWGMILREVVLNTAGIDPWKLPCQWLDDSERLPRRSALQCMLVCKEWKDIVLPIACEDLRLSTKTSWASFIKTLEGREHLAHNTRKLKLQHRRDTSTRVYDECPFKPILHTFLLPFTALQSLEVALMTFPPAAFATLSRNVSSLSRLVISTYTVADTVYKLPHFPSLRELEWLPAEDTDFEALDPDSKDPLCPKLERLKLEGEGTTRLFRLLVRNGLPLLTDAELGISLMSLGDFDISGEGVLDPITLPLLKNLVVGGKGLLHFLTPLHLPELESLVLDNCDIEGVREFCGAHGHLIKSVRNGGRDHHINFFLESCPNVSKIEFHGAFGDPAAFSPLKPLRRVHSALTELVCPSRRWSEPTTARYAKFAQADLEEWTRFLDSLPLDQLPSLRTLQVSDSKLWPTTAKDAKKHPLPAIAEGLAERGVRLVDEKGVGWKPRITTKRK